MSTTIAVTARVTPETAAALDGLAARLGKPLEEVVAEAVRAYVEEQTEFLDFIAEGERDIDEGRFYTQDQMEVWLKEQIAEARAVARAKAA